MSEARQAEIVVIAGVNGAGKSSVVGESLRQRGADYHNPDELTRDYLNRGLGLDEANSRAWQRGRQALIRAVDDGLDFAFETTLGGRTMTDLLIRAVRRGMRVRLIYFGLASPGLHIERVRARVLQGGHAIPEERIRQRWQSSRQNLIRLLPHLSELRVFDNSLEADPQKGAVPSPRLLFAMRDGQIVHSGLLDEVPDWAKPVMMAAARL
ncbi:MAG: AAA family ATPase [Longimicrobiales bacterium]